MSLQVILSRRLEWESVNRFEKVTYPGLCTVNKHPGTHEASEHSEFPIEDNAGLVFVDDI
jgi:hypothetical protein